MTTDPTPSTTTARETTVTENQPTDQTPAADPTPGSSRVDVAGLRAAAEAATPGPWEAGHGWVYTQPIYSDDDRLADIFGVGYVDTDRALAEVARGNANAAYVAAADPTTVLALLDERDDLAARLATAEAEAERLTGSVVALVRAHGEALLERNEAERQVQAGLAVLDGHDHADTCGAVLSPGAKYPCSCWKADLIAALAPLDPDAPTGHEGHGDPDTHQGDTEAGERCSTCGAPWQPVRRGECLHCGSDAGPERRDTEAGDGR